MGELLGKMLDAESNLERAKQEYEMTRFELQLKCEHKDVVQAKYLHSDYGRSLPDFRVCKTCGYAEEGWGCGYSFLAPDVVRFNEEIERDEAMKFVRGGIHSNEKHTDVRHGRKSVEDLLRPD